MKMVWLLLLITILAVVEATPPGIAKNPSHATCKDPSYKECHNLVHVCPKFCPDTCHVHCQSCKPICGPEPPPLPAVDPETPPSPPPPSPDSPPPPVTPSPWPLAPPPPEDSFPRPPPPPAYPPPPTGTPETPPVPAVDPVTPPPPLPPSDSPQPPAPVTPSPWPLAPPPPQDSFPVYPPPPPPPSYPPPPTGTPDPTLETPPPTLVTPAPPPTPPTTETTYTQPPTTPRPPSPTVETPPPPMPETPGPPASETPPWEIPPPPTTEIPQPPPPQFPPPGFYPYRQPPDPATQPPFLYTPPDLYAAQRRKRCVNRNYPQCYGVQHECPNSCPYTCQVDCVTCKPVCSCDQPGAVCQDPRFIGGDGITFYFHGKKDRDFCLVTDPKLHINAHFIGRRNDNMKRDFTWVQSIGILFGDHRLFLGAQKTATWNNGVDRLALSFDGEPVALPTKDGATWQPQTLSSTLVKRDANTNSITIEVDGLFKISAKVVPITKRESDVHNYGITDDDCFAHLELAFKFYSVSDKIDGVLGQTYRSGYVSRAKMGVAMPVLGGERAFKVSNLFATDCSVSQFEAGKSEYVSETNLELPSMKCGSGIGGRGVVCKR